MTTTRDKVIVGLSGGLGNQMFQYAAGRALAVRLEVPLVLDLAWFAGRKDRVYALGGYALPASTDLHAPQTPAMWASLWSRATRRFSKHKLGAPVIREPHFQFAPHVPALRSAAYLEGYWQSPKYFDDVADQIRADFQLAEPLSATRREICDKMQAANAVSVHVRRGDYVTNATASAHHGTCSPAWYRAAMSDMSERVANPTFFVFSDDPDWARENLPKDWPTVYVPPQSDGHDFEDLHLMALCNHHIIANSSFSWWGAWLNPSDSKQVLAPKQWFLSQTNDTRDLLPESWVRI